MATLGGGGDDGEGDKVQKKSRIRSFLDGYPKWREALFLTSVGGFGLLFGFGATVAGAKKQDPEGFDKGMMPATSRGGRVRVRAESGVGFAVRALRWGTFYAVTGTGLICFVVWKCMGVANLQEFRQKAGHILPKIPKNEPQGRTEFENLTELFQYVIDEDNRAKAEAKKEIKKNASSKNKDNDVSSSSGI